MKRSIESRRTAGVKSLFFRFADERLATVHEHLRMAMVPGSSAQGAAAVAAAAAAGAGHPAVKQQTAEGCPPEWNSLAGGQQNPMVRLSKLR